MSWNLISGSFTTVCRENKIIAKADESDESLNKKVYMCSLLWLAKYLLGKETAERPDWSTCPKSYTKCSSVLFPPLSWEVRVVQQFCAVPTPELRSESGPAVLCCSRSSAEKWEWSSSSVLFPLLSWEVRVVQQFCAVPAPQLRSEGGPAVLCCSRSWAEKWELSSLICYNVLISSYFMQVWYPVF
jgi:hypothetical protein